MPSEELPEDIIFDVLGFEDLQAAYNIEVAGFPPDEAASLQSFRYRQAHAPSLFLGAFVPTSMGSIDPSRALIGYVNSTLSPSPTLTHTSMSEHVSSPDATSVCIHGVCVHPKWRRRGIATVLLREYLKRIQEESIEKRKEGSGGYERVLLITHEEMKPLYEGAGFEWVGRSEVRHGSRPWFEMRYLLPASSSDVAPSSEPETKTLTGLEPLAAAVSAVDNDNTATATAPSTKPLHEISDQAQLTQTKIPAGLWEALQSQSIGGSGGKKRPKGKLLAGLKGGLDEVSKERSGEKWNSCDLVCPREGCGSIIIKSGVAKVSERESIQMEPPERSQPLLPALPAPPSKTFWWQIGPGANAMAFENVGFSKAVNTAAEKPMKLLACAECDLGPVGWCYEGGDEYLLAASRVGYLV